MNDKDKNLESLAALNSLHSEVTGTHSEIIIPPQRPILFTPGTGEHTHATTLAQGIYKLHPKASRWIYICDDNLAKASRALLLRHKNHDEDLLDEIAGYAGLPMEKVTKPAHYGLREFMKGFFVFLSESYKLLSQYRLDQNRVGPVPSLSEIVDIVGNDELFERTIVDAHSEMSEEFLTPSQVAAYDWQKVSKNIHGKEIPNPLYTYRNLTTSILFEYGGDNIGIMHHFFDPYIGYVLDDAGADGIPDLEKLLHIARFLRVVESLVSELKPEAIRSPMVINSSANDDQEFYPFVQEELYRSPNDRNDSVCYPILRKPANPHEGMIFGQEFINIFEELYRKQESGRSHFGSLPKRLQCGGRAIDRTLRPPYKNSR